MENKGGRPPKWTTPEALQEDIDRYFDETPKEEWTITGLALALDTYRQTLLNYENQDEFVDTVKKAKLRVENSYEIDLKKSGRTGTIFALKNFDWKDKQEVEAKVKDVVYKDISEMSQEEIDEYLREKLSSTSS